MSILTEINRIKTAVTSIVQAIRGKGITVPDTAKIGDLATIISNIPTRTKSDLTVDGKRVWTAAGYYANDTYQEVAAATRAQTTILATADDTNDKLTLTASNNQTEGYVYNSNQTATVNVTLTASGATVTAKTDGLPRVSVSKTVTDTNLVAGNIKKGVSIFGVTGTYEGGGGGINVTLPNCTVTVCDRDYAGNVVVTVLVNEGGVLKPKSTNVPSGGTVTLTYAWRTPVFITSPYLSWCDVYDAEGDYIRNCPYTCDATTATMAYFAQIDGGNRHHIDACQ